MESYFFTGLNWLAIAVAAVAYFMLGAIWYSFLFKKTWIRASGVDMNNPDAKKGAAGIMVLTLVLEFVACIGLDILATRLLLIGGGVLSGAKLGLLTGVCFAAVAITISFMYQMKPKVLSVIDSGYHIVGNIVAAIIICLWT
jgi:hypothetical protein